MGEKKIFLTRLDSDGIKDLKHLAVDTDKSLGQLLEEAVKEICREYEKQSKKYPLARVYDLNENPIFQIERWGFVL